MASAREMRLRIRSVNNISQVTRALEAVSASRVRKAEQLVRTYSMFVQFNILGRMVYQTQDKVSWYG